MVTNLHNHSEASYSIPKVSKTLDRVKIAAHLRVSIVAGLFFLGAGEPTEASWVIVAPTMIISEMGSMKVGCVLMDRG
jgi:hypothetical protein